MSAKEDSSDPAEPARRRRRAFWLTLAVAALIPTALQHEWLPRGPRLAMALATSSGGSGHGASGHGAAVSLRMAARTSALERCAYAAWKPGAGPPSAEAPMQPAIVAELAPTRTLRAPGGDPEGRIIPISQVTPATDGPTGLVGGSNGGGLVGGGDGLTPIQPVTGGPPVVPPGNPSVPSVPVDPGPLVPAPPVVVPANPGPPVIIPVSNPGGTPTGGPTGPTGPTGPQLPIGPTGPQLPAGPGGGNPIRPTAPVPEPAAWMMLIVGFGLTGASLRRRAVVAQ